MLLLNFNTIVLNRSRISKVEKHGQILCSYFVHFCGMIHSLEVGMLVYSTRYVILDPVGEVANFLAHLINEGNQCHSLNAYRSELIWCKTSFQK